MSSSKRRTCRNISPDDGYVFFVCSECHATVSGMEGVDYHDDGCLGSSSDFRYCPNCGAHVEP